jgi:thiol-disulfide isomerase/thioredoxin
MDAYFDDKNVIFLEDEDFDGQGQFRHNLKGRPLVVMMGGSFCPHCRHAAPAFNEFAKMSRQNRACVPAVIQVDRSENEGRLASKLGALFKEAARGVPCYLMFGPNGKFVRAHEGDRSAAALLEFVNNKN